MECYKQISFGDLVFSPCKNYSHILVILKISVWECYDPLIALLIQYSNLMMSLFTFLPAYLYKYQTTAYQGDFCDEQNAELFTPYSIGGS